MGAHLNSNSRYETGALWLHTMASFAQIKARNQSYARIEYRKETVDGDIAQVETKTKLKDGTEYSVNYKLSFCGHHLWRSGCLRI
jgi:hypothetical protein